MELLDNKALREEMMEKVEVLSNVKKLILLPSTELMTTKMIAEYFEVTEEVIRDNIRRNREELERNGVKTMKYSEIKSLVNSETFSQLRISRNGSTIFSKRAVLNIAMLLRDSVIAKEVRQALLDQQDVMTDNQKVNGINVKHNFLLAIITASTDLERAVAMNEYEQYNNKHIKELNENIDRMKPKEEAFDHFISAGNYQKMNNVAKSLNIGRNKLFDFLRESKVLMADNTPYQTYVDRGWFVVRQNTVVRENFSKNVTQTFVTSKGVEAIHKLLKNNH